MSLIAEINQFQIISDGKSIVLLLDSEVCQGAAVLKNTRMTTCGIKIITDSFGVGSGFPYTTEYYPISNEVQCDFSVLASEGKFMDISNPILELDFFRNMTVRELFKEINKKLNRR